MTSPTSMQPSWLAEFDVPAEPSGAVVAVDFGEDGLWAGRIERGVAVSSETEPRIRPAVLDARIAAYLRSTGAVEAPTPEAYGELVAVVARGRHALIGHDSSLTMGHEHLRLVRLGLDDVIEATVPEANRAHGMIVELAGADPVDAVLLGPGHDEWPGLWESLTERGFTVLLPGDAFPVVFGGDDQPTELLAPVVDRADIRAWDDVGDNSALVDPSDYGLDRFGNAMPDAAGIDDGGVVPPAANDDPQPVQQGLRGRVVALGVIVMFAVGGGAVVLAMNASESRGPDLTSAETISRTSPTSAGPEPEHVHVVVNPNDLDAARAPMSEYSKPPPPPPPPSSTPRQTEARPGPKPPAPTRPKRRTIPNPIPGLPPIVVG